MWGEIEEEDRHRWCKLKRHGAIVGHVQQFASNAPTTYAWALGGRIGAFESWEAAQSAVEKATGFCGEAASDMPTSTQIEISKEDARRLLNWFDMMLRSEKPDEADKELVDRLQSFIGAKEYVWSPDANGD